MLTKEQIENCIDEAKFYLRLTHWTTVVDWSEETVKACDDEDAMAMVSVVPYRYFATIAFCKDIFEMDTKKVSMIITHELLHLHSDSVLKNPMELIRRCSADVQDAVATTLRNDIEHMTDALAFAFSGLIGEYDAFAPTEGEDAPVKEATPEEAPVVVPTESLKAETIKIEGNVYWYAKGH
jgi:hypothetical protein